jgi:2-aminoethylphosphonate-pyruvate transaminase
MTSTGPERRVLLNPGPATTSEAVKAALVIPDICPREVEFCAQLADVRRRLAELAGDPAHIAAIPIVGSGTTALEAMLISLVPPDGRVIVIDNGVYGRRMVEIARTCGIEHQVIAFGDAKPVDLAKVEAVLRASASAATHLAFVHHETSSGMLNPLEGLTQLARRFGLAVLLDAMSSFGAIPIRVGEDGVDALVSSANKCLQAMPGLAFAIATRSSLDRARGTKPRSYVLDLVAELDQLEKTSQMRFTCPPQIVSALHRALLEIETEGLIERGKRYRHSMQTLVRGLAKLGFELLLEAPHQSQILVAVREPREPWYDFGELHDALYRLGFTIYPGHPGAGGGQPNFRLSVLGDIDSRDIEAFLAALESCLTGMKNRPATANQAPEEN